MWIKLNQQQIEGSNATAHLPLPRFLKRFFLKKQVRRATLQISALGIFSLEINGRKIQEYFMPGCTNYNKFVDLCQYDLTHDLKKDNVLSITLADGWFKGRLGYFRKETFGKELCLFAQLIIKFEDGTTQIIQTDESWKVQNSEIVHADFFDGQIIDERLREDALLVYDELPNAIVTDEKRTFRVNNMERVVCVQKLQAETLRKTDKWLLDFRQNFAGVLSFTAKGKSGTTIVVRHAEMLDENGELYVANLRKADCTDKLTLSDKPARFSPEFTYHGFRYAEISVENGSIEDVEITELEGLVLSQNLRRTGYFVCANPLVNRIYENIYWGQLGNFISIPTDCPQRDERLGWTGDAQVFCDTAMYNADCKEFFRSYMDLVRADTLENGSVPGFAPFECEIYRNHGSPCWGDAITIIPYMHYLAYGDATIIQENLPTAKKWIDFYNAHLKDGLVDDLWSYGDWLSVGEETDKNALMQCYYGYSLLLTAMMCAIVRENGSQYQRQYEQAKLRFRETFVHDDGTITSDTQTIYAVAYSVGFMTAEEIRKPLVNAIHRRDDTLTTGFIGVKFLLPTLCNVGETELAYKLIGQTKYPSWGYCVENGATTIWERWDGYTAENGFFDPSMNSYNHYSLGSCGWWLYAYVLGIRLTERTASHGEVLIKPAFSAQMNWAKGSYQTPKGKISISWKYKRDYITVIVEADDTLSLEYDFGGHTILSQTKDGKTTTFTLAKLKVSTFFCRLYRIMLGFFSIFNRG